MPPFPTQTFNTSDEVLQWYLRFSPPDHALWKSIEWRLFREYEYPEPVLDLGCGDGVFARAVFGHALMAGIDILPNRVRKAQQAKQYRLPVTGDATRMPFAAASFQTVFSGCAMEHVPPMPQMLAEIARVLKPGGQLITTVPSGYFSDYLFLSTTLRRAGLHALAEHYGRGFARLMTIFHLYHPAQWQQLLRDAGLELVEARHFLPRHVTSLFERLVFAGNAAQPLTWLVRGTPLHQRYVEWLCTKLLPYTTDDDVTGGALLLVARKPE